ncbi:uncharacterized protein AMSG_10909 [Thecamonas trahens ATCC 50062]|uniref:Uncharacterized protein n=1 Tax=Thecamonas trahens ATCC 50062 TaxID=461836 RepID=A0A0L0DSM5_THETB|nr:hypothetical protein AMSG_10909 [Thecamonas trahens ATCC 50062]KNC55270.1 hypothetical protein AMSG_10909 [Thecamonas trahens ATCC 50062]|eukprot:XP_013753093.1 hypothetical protein AMSG_10909 [Thecamonas trahens ATCC 50062]
MSEARVGHAALSWHKVPNAHMTAVKRRGHSAVAHGSEVVVFGGWAASAQEDMWVFNSETLRWRRVAPQTAQATPSRRFGHSAVGDGAGGMLVFGGESGVRAFNDLWRLDIDEWEWTRFAVQPSAPVPSPRYGHAAVYYDGVMLVHGGADRFPSVSTGTALDGELWAYDVASKSWTEVMPMGATPAPRYGHTLTVVAGSVYCFGGFSEAGRLGDLWRLDPVTFAWEVLDPVGERPQRRTGHVAAEVGGNLVVFGGRGASVLEDAWLYRVAENRWERVEATARGVEVTGGVLSPSPVFDHAATVVDGSFITFGGLSETNSLSGAVWYLSTEPERRSGEAATELASNLAGLRGDAFIDEVARLLQSHTAETTEVVEESVKAEVDSRVVPLQAQIEDLRMRLVLLRHGHAVSVPAAGGASGSGSGGRSGDGGAGVSPSRASIRAMEESVAEFASRLELVEDTVASLQTEAANASMASSGAGAGSFEATAALEAKLARVETRMDELEVAAASSGGAAGAAGASSELDELRFAVATLKTSLRDVRKEQYANLKKLHENQKSNLKVLEKRVEARVSSMLASSGGAGSGAASAVELSPGVQSAIAAAVERRTAAVQVEYTAKLRERDADLRAFKSKVLMALDELRMGARTGPPPQPSPAPTLSADKQAQLEALDAFEGQIDNALAGMTVEDLETE